MNIWVFIYRLAWTVLVIVGLAALVAFFTPKVRQLRDMSRQEEKLQQENRLQEDMLQHLKKKQERLQTDPRFVEKIAREELGLAKPGETVFKFMDDAATNRRGSAP